MYNIGYVAQSHKHFSKKKPSHPNMSRVYRNPLSRNSVRDTEWKVVWLWRDYCVATVYGRFLCCFCLWSLEMDTRNVWRDRKIVCDFGLTHPRILFYEFHEWIYDQICLNYQEASMVQIDLPKRQVYITFRVNGRM